LWNHTDETEGDGYWKVPSTDPYVDSEKPVSLEEKSKLSGIDEETFGKDGKYVFVSPMYDHLETNIPKNMMCFSDFDFPNEVPVYPGHRSVKLYLWAYATEVNYLIRFGTQVTKVEMVPPAGQGLEQERWKVESVSLVNDMNGEKASKPEPVTRTYDAVVICSGHFSAPYIPDIPGISSWSNQHPSTVTHSKYYRHPSTYAGKTVLVIGSSASGVDIAAHLSEAADKVILSQRADTASFTQTMLADYAVQVVGEIQEFDPDSRSIRFKDGSPTIHGIDNVVFCTGYLYTLPFINNNDSAIEEKLVNSGTMIHGTYEHIFLAKHPTLGFMAINQRIVPFPVAEIQACVLARLYSGRLVIPSLEEMQAWERGVMEEMGEEDFPLLQFPRDADYMDEMLKWAATATPKETGEEEELPKGWGPKERWWRSKFPLIRGAFGKLGEDRFNVRTIEDLGFVYEAEGEQI
jgi:cation diffusion facilitator CzcD-associated flavoprotein CzcO